MEIKLKIDNENKPYLKLCVHYPEGLEDQALELFINEAKKNGVKFQDEGYSGKTDYYVTIRLKKKGEK